MAQRLQELDSLRGIAAIGVVTYHFFYRYDEIYNPSDYDLDWAFFGAYGVQLFFVISGFVIFWSLQRVEHPFDFPRARFARLYPAYWVSMIATFTIVSIWGGPEAKPTWTEFAFNLTMFQQLFDVRHIDAVYWTLTVELLFYLGMFLLLALGRLHWAEPVLAALVTLSFLSATEIVEISRAVQGVLIIHHLPFFLAGICIYKTVNGQATWMTALAFSLAVLAVSVGFPPAHLPIFAVFFAVFWLAVSGRMTWLRARPLVYLGSISYALYLIHLFIGFVVIREAVAYRLPLLLGIALAFAVCLCLAHMIRTLVEVPAGRYLRQRLG